MLVHISSKEGRPETVMKAWKRPFMTAVAIVSNKKWFIFLCLSEGGRVCAKLCLWRQIDACPHQRLNLHTSKSIHDTPAVTKFLWLTANAPLNSEASW